MRFGPEPNKLVVEATRYDTDVSPGSPVADLCSRECLWKASGPAVFHYPTGVDSVRSTGSVRRAEREHSPDKLASTINVSESVRCVPIEPHGDL